MRSRLVLAILCGAAASAVSPPCMPDPAASSPAAGQAMPTPRILVSRVVPDLKTVRPVQMVQVPDQPDLWYLAEQPGRIKLVDLTNRELVDAPLVVDLTDRVNDGSNEEGLLSIAFHPEYPRKRELYAYYSAHPPRRSVLSRFTVSEDGRSIRPESEEVVLEVPQPFWNHNGGTALFGPDGHLYLSLGDGGAANDPHDAGQDLSTLLAKVIRIDVNRASDGKRYAIPSDNPFVGRKGAAPEIWAYGLRNVWRMHFDRKTGDLWAGDVGQNKWEEIDLITKGGNYGWKVREGAHPFARSRFESGAEPIEPIVDYPRSDGISVTGGFVYRGTAIPSLEGVYLYADFVSGTIWGIRKPTDGTSRAEPMVLVRKPGSLWSSFAEAADGTLYLLSFQGGQSPGQAGAIWRIVPGT